MSDDEMILVGGPTGDFPGSRQYICSRCSGPLWLAPSGQHTLAATPSVYLMCFECCMKYFDESEENEFQVTRESLLEFMAWRKRN